MAIEVPFCMGVDRPFRKDPARAVALRDPVRLGKQEQSGNIIQMNAVCISHIEGNMFKNDLIHTLIMGLITIHCGCCRCY